MYRRIIIIFVASIFIFSCKNKPKSNDRVEVLNTLYSEALSMKDYNSSISYLNELVLLDPKNIERYYDSLAFYYLKKVQNYTAGKIIVDKALKLNPRNYKMLEYKSVFASADEDFKTADEYLNKAYEISKQKRYLYMIASLHVQQRDIEKYYKIVRSILDDPNYKPEKVEVAVSETEEQMVELKALCYSDLAQLAIQANNDIKGAYIYIDSALMIEPKYIRALYMKEELDKMKNKKK